VARWFRRRVGIALGVMASGFGASGLIVPLVVGLIDLHTWRSTLIILAVGMWVLGIPLSMVIRDRPEPYGYLPDGASPSTPGEAEAEQAGSAGVPFLEAFKNASFLFVTLAEAVRLLGVTAVVVHVMPYLQNAGVERKFAGFLAASIPLVSILGRFGFGWLSDRVEKRVVMAVAFLIMAGGLLAFSFVHIPGMLLVFLLLFSPGFGGSMVLRGAILRDYFGTQAFGKLIGIVMGAGSVGGIIGPTVAGWIFDTLGSYRPVWFVLSGLTFLASALVLQVRPAKGMGAPGSP
jgi:MFS family permease